jgi:hypothetical protein
LDTPTGAILRPPRKREVASAIRFGNHPSLTLSSVAMAALPRCAFTCCIQSCIYHCIFNPHFFRLSRLIMIYLLERFPGIT